jgi:hypothetical protein
MLTFFIDAQRFARSDDPVTSLLASPPTSVSIYYSHRHIFVGDLWSSVKTACLPDQHLIIYLGTIMLGLSSCGVISIVYYRVT